MSDGAAPPTASGRGPGHAPPFDRIVFDCDSTLSSIEGIEELSGEHKDEIARLTRAAMAGEIPLEEVYGKRLEIVAPRRRAVATVGRRYIETVSPKAREVVSALKLLGKEVVVISGGLRLAVTAFAGWLGIDDAHVYAVKAFFDPDERIQGFDRNSPLARSGGKKEVLSAMKQARTAFVGDGMTDAEARDVVDCFVCYQGHAAHPEVAALAHVVVPGPSFADLLPVLCSPDELDTLRRDPRHGRLLVPPLSG
jgi:phosphoserine phosphatase